MKKNLFIFIGLLAVQGVLLAQSKPTIAILPFTGGQEEDGETIAELFSFEPALTAAFAPIPRTSINRAIRNEQKFQLGSGMTDADTAVALGKQVGARYIVAGTITALGKQRLLIIGIIDTEKLQQIAGDYQLYTQIEEVQAKLPDMARNIAAAARRDTSKLPKLAVVPFQIRSSTNSGDADALAQILGIHIIRSGKYAVYPRTASLEQVQEEYAHQLSGDTADEEAVRLGAGDNPVLVLSGMNRRLGSGNMFNALILNLVTGIQEQGATVNYQTLEDGISGMEKLAYQLTTPPEERARAGSTPVVSTGSTTERAGTNNLVRINGGTFLMGSPGSEAGRDNDETQHSVTVSSFYIGKYEATVGEFRRFVNATGYKTDAEKSGGGYVWTGSQWEQKADANWKNPYMSQGDNHPVVLVSWNDAVRYCNWLSEQEKLTPAYTVNGTTVTWNRSANGYRLPTEAEWEYACRAGTTTPFSTGNNITTSQANYDGNYPYNNNAKGTYRQKTTAAGSFGANAWGLYDMHGNVWEWCWDWYGAYSTGSQTDPAGVSSGSARVYRGGCWNGSGQYVRSASRNYSDPAYRFTNLGFRVVRP